MEMNYAHIKVEVIINKSDFWLDEPRKEDSVSFKIPVLFYDEKKIGAIVSNLVENLQKELADSEKELTEDDFDPEDWGA